MAFGEIVDDENVVAGRRKLLGGVRADIAGSAGDEYAHGNGPESSRGGKTRAISAPARWVRILDYEFWRGRAIRDRREAGKYVEFAAVDFGVAAGNRAARLVAIGRSDCVDDM